MQLKLKINPLVYDDIKNGLKDTEFRVLETVVFECKNKPPLVFNIKQIWCCEHSTWDILHNAIPSFFPKGPRLGIRFSPVVEE